VSNCTVCKGVSERKAVALRDMLKGEVSAFARMSVGDTHYLTCMIDRYFIEFGVLRGGI